MNDIVVKKVESKKDIKDFVKLTDRLYKNDKYYVPNFKSDDYGLFNVKANPYLKTCKVYPLVVYKDGICVGRVVGIIHPGDDAKEIHGRVRFHYFDIINDFECMKALFDELTSWAKKNNRTSMVGPIGFNDTDREGLLIDGFETVGTFVSYSNYPYYKDLLEQYGFSKDVDWLQYRLTSNSNPEQEAKIKKVSEWTLNKLGLRIVKEKNTKDIIKKWGYKIFDLVDLAYNKLYATVKLDEEIINLLFKKFAQIINKNLVVLIADKEDNLIAFVFGFPSLSKALQETKGRMFPFGFIKFLKAIKHYDVVDLGLIGVHPEYLKLGINSILMSELSKEIFRPEIKHVETNLMLEYNTDILSMVNKLDAKPYRRNRSFIKNI